MIERRVYARMKKAYEYYYKGEWYILSLLSAHPDCKVELATLRARINHHYKGNPTFKTLEDCLQDVMPLYENLAKATNKIKKRYIPEDTPGKKEFIQTMNLFKPIAPSDRGAR